MTGAPPFVRESRSGLFGAHMFARSALDDALTSTSAAALRDAIAIGLAKHPRDRHGSCAALMRAAQQCRVVGLSTSAPRAVTAAPVAGAAHDGAADASGADDEGRDATGASGGLAARRVSAREWLGRLPSAVVPILALVAGLIVTFLLLGVLREDNTTTASGDGEAAARGDDPAPANAAAVGRPQDQDAGQEAPPESPAGAAVHWDSAVDDASVVSVAATADVVVATTDGGVYTLDGASGASRAPGEIVAQNTPTTVVTHDAIVYQDAGLHARSLDDGGRCGRAPTTSLRTRR